MSAHAGALDKAFAAIAAAAAVGLIDAIARIGATHLAQLQERAHELAARSILAQLEPDPEPPRPAPAPRPRTKRRRAKKSAPAKKPAPKQRRRAAAARVVDEVAAAAPEPVQPVVVEEVAEVDEASPPAPKVIHRDLKPSNVPFMSAMGAMFRKPPAPRIEPPPITSGRARREHVDDWAARQRVAAGVGRGARPPGGALRAVVALGEQEVQVAPCELPTPSSTFTW